MMKLTNLLRQLYEYLYNYNLFIPETDGNDAVQNEIVLKRQKYSTWLYIFLLIVSLYVIFFIALINPQPQTTTISNVTSDMFEQLHQNYSQTLSCPCSKISIPYKTFVSNTIKFHPICSSIFVSQQWIDALYRLDASTFNVLDFRKTAHSQFKLLASLCSLSKDTVYQNKMNLDNNEFLSLYLLSEEQVKSEVLAMVETLQNSTIIRITSFISYLKIITRANYFISALNTNLVLAVRNNFVMLNIFAGWIRFYKDAYANDVEMTCGNANPIRPTGFYLSGTNSWFAGLSFIAMALEPYAMIDGFYAGCTSFEALLPSTFTCLYDIKCLELLNEYFSTFDQLHLNSSDYVLTGNYQNLSVNDYLLNLFIEEWSTQIDYTTYFHQCASSYCTYTKIVKTDRAYAMTLLISLYGGFVFLYRLIAPLIVNIARKLKHNSRNIRLNSQYIRTRIQKLTTTVKELNLFKEENNRTEQNINQQKIITRVYLILLTGTFLGFILYTTLTTKTATITEPNPLLDTYSSLKTLYSNTLKCPCSNMAIPYHQFISLSPKLHQVCSSDLVSQAWISILMSIVSEYTAIDWRSQIGPQIQLLSDLCQLANQTIDDAINRLVVQSFITLNVISELEFYQQMNSTLDTFFQSTIIYFDQLVDTVRLHMQIDQPFTQLGRVLEAIPTNIIVNDLADTMNDPGSLELKILLGETHDINSTITNCVCATNPYCQSQTAIYDFDPSDFEHVNPYIVYNIPGMIQGCFVIDSLMLSTLECFYSHMKCLPIISNYIKESYYRNAEYPQWFDIHLLVYDRNVSRFPPNTTIERIVKEMMIEKWNPVSLYNRYYKLCAPTYCTYSKTIRENTNVEIIVSVISTVGGLVSILGLITPYLFKFAYWVRSVLCKKQQQQQQQQNIDRPNRYNQLKANIRQAMMFLYKALIDLNMFSVTDFGSKTNRATAKRLGQWATRLYMILLIVGFAVLAIYTTIEPETLTKKFDKPPFDQYNHLKETYGEKLECSCSIIASKYETFVTIQPEFHQICSSPFVSTEWQNNLISALASNLSIYDMKDYRRYISAHLQFLTGLCQISMQTVNNSIDQFLSSLFTTTQLLSQSSFHSRLDSLIDQSKSNAPIIFTRLLFLIRNINHENAIISTYGSNYKYITSTDDLEDGFTRTQAIVYDNNCSCGLHHNCTTQANFIKSNLSETVPIKGLKIGCTPTESFFASNLECFYDLSCIHLIQQYTNSPDTHTALAKNMSRFAMNITIAELINDLFVEEWKTMANYSLYFQHCSPSICSYTYIQKLYSFYTITLLLGFHGGYTIVLEWICPILVYIIFKIYQHRKRRTNIIQPVSTDRMTRVKTVVIKDSNSIAIAEPITTSIIVPPTNSVRYSLKMPIVCTFMFIVIAGLTVFSIYFARQANHEVTSSTVWPFNTTVTMEELNPTTVKMASTSTTSESTCQLKFQSIAANTDIYSLPFSPVVADFNNDNKLDVAVIFRDQSRYVKLLLGRGNGTFGSGTIFPVQNDYSLLAIADFNNDKRIDLAFLDILTNHIGIWFNHGDATFEPVITSSINMAINANSILINKFNKDNDLDIAVFDSSLDSISVYAGHGNGTFTLYTRFYIGLASVVMLNIGDFNQDGYLDIVITKPLRNLIIVFLGYGNGIFKAQREIPVGPNFNLGAIAVDDCNNDKRLDIVFLSRARYEVGILFGYGNGSFSMKKDIFISGGTPFSSSVSISDLNEDGFLDIIVGSVNPYTIHVLIGRGNETFEIQEIFSNEDRNTGSLDFVVNDFDNDGHQDILATNYFAATIDVLLNTCQCCTSNILDSKNN